MKCDIEKCKSEADILVHGHHLCMDHYHDYFQIVDDGPLDFEYITNAKFEEERP